MQKILKSTIIKAWKIRMWRTRPARASSPADFQGQSIQGPLLAARFAQFCTSPINSGPGWAVSSWQLPPYHLHLPFVILMISCMPDCGPSRAMENISPRNAEFQLNPGENQSSGSTSPVGLGLALSHGGVESSSFERQINNKIKLYGKLSTTS